MYGSGCRAGASFRNWLSHRIEAAGVLMAASETRNDDEAHCDGCEQFTDDKARCDIERRKQRGRAVPHVAGRAAFGYAGHHRQYWLLAIKGLNLALLIDTKDQGSVGRRQVEADNNEPYQQTADHWAA